MGCSLLLLSAMVWVIVVRVMVGQAWSVLGDGASATAGRRVNRFSFRLVDTADGCGLGCNIKRDRHDRSILT